MCTVQCMQLALSELYCSFAHFLPDTCTIYMTCCTPFYRSLLWLYHFPLSYPLTFLPPQLLTHPLTYIQTYKTTPFMATAPLLSSSQHSLSYSLTRTPLAVYSPTLKKEASSYHQTCYISIDLHYVTLHIYRPTLCYVTKTRSCIIHHYEKLKFHKPKIYVWMYYIMYLFFNFFILTWLSHSISNPDYIGWTNRVTG